jgi:peptide/nickel transport system substrate-binding protein
VNQQSPSARRYELSRRQLLRAGAFGSAAASVGVLGACSSGASTATTRTAAKKANLVIAFSDATDSDTLDPAAAQDTYGATLVSNIYEPLCAIDFSQNYRAVPLAAETITPNSTLTEWTFQLRDCRFADGKPLTADDVAFTIKRLLNKTTGGTIYASLSPYLSADGIKILGSRTIKLVLNSPNAFILETFGDLHSGIVQEGTTKFTGIGAGPFQATSFTPGTGFVLEPNAHYWQPGVPMVNSLRGVIIADQTTKIESLLNGTSDLIDPIDYSYIKLITAGNSAKFAPVKNGTAFRIDFDPTKPPFSDVRVIQAMKLAANRPEFVSLVTQGHGTVAYDVPIVPSSPYFPKNLIQQQDVGGAKQLLAEAGYPHGLSIDLYTSDVYAGMVDLAVVFAQQMKSAGITVNVQQAPESTYWTNYFMVKDAFVSYWPQYPPYATLADQFEPTNEERFNNAMVNSITQRLTHTPSLSNQISLVQQALGIIAKDAAATFPFFGDTLWVTKSNVSGIAFDYYLEANLRHLYTTA